MKATKRKVPSKTKRAQAFIESNPAALVNEVANRFGMAKQSVYALRNKMKKDGFVFPKRADQLASLAPATLEIEMFDFPDEVDETLDARALDYGKFIEGAEVMQMLKRVVHLFYSSILHEQHHHHIILS